MKLKLKPIEKVAIFFLCLIFMWSLGEAILFRDLEEAKFAILTLCVMYVYAEVADYLNR